MLLRYLKDSMDNEPDRTWNKEMRSLVRENDPDKKAFSHRRIQIPKKFSSMKKIPEDTGNCQKGIWREFRKVITIGTGIIYF